MSVDQTTICNMAASRLSQGKIQSITQINSTTAEFCNLFYDQVRQYLLRRFNWSFSKNIVNLALTTGTAIGWTYEYQKPSDCLRIRHLSPEGGTDLINTFIGGEMVYVPNPANPTAVPFDIVGDKIWTNLEDAKIVYSKDVSTEAMFDPMFTDVFAWRLAFEVAMPLTGKHVLRDKMELSYDKALLQASAVAANETNTQRPTFQSDLLKARQ